MTSKSSKDAVQQSNYYDFLLTSCIGPELARRHKRGEVEDRLDIKSFQLVVNSTVPLEIRINDQVKGVLVIKSGKRLNKRFNTGDSLNAALHFKIEEDEGYAVSVTYLELFPDRGVLFFGHGELVLSRDKIRRVGQNFLAIARTALAAGYYEAFYENLFASIELICLGLIVSLPVDHRLDRRSPVCRGQVNDHADFEAIDDRYRFLLEHTFCNRNDMKLSGIEASAIWCDKILESADDFHEFVDGFEIV